MNSSCPICDVSAVPLEISATNLPQFHVISSSTRLGREHFGSLNLGWCPSCDHYFNMSVVPDTPNDLRFTTNQSVSGEMSARHDSLSNYLTSYKRDPGLVLDIGSGSGGYARALSKCGHRVIALEPTLNIACSTNSYELVVDVWPSKLLEGVLFDLIICVQVLEHLPDPVIALLKIIQSLDHEGLAYVEVPSGDWVFFNSSPIDIHIPHRHYFTQRSFHQMLENVGAELIDVRPVLSGRDTGYLIRKGFGTTRKVSRTRLASRHTGVLERIRFLNSHVIDENQSVAVYGANAGCQAFLGWTSDFSVSMVVDDTPAYWGHDVYSNNSRIRVLEPTLQHLHEIDHVIIASYNHDSLINNKLKQLGYTGLISTLRPTSVASDQLQSLFASLT